MAVGALAAGTAPGLAGAATVFKPSCTFTFEGQWTGASDHRGTERNVPMSCTKPTQVTGRADASYSYQINSAHTTVTITAEFTESFSSGSLTEHNVKIVERHANLPGLENEIAASTRQVTGTGSYADPRDAKFLFLITPDYGEGTIEVGVGGEVLVG